jgi:hypothetical protein
MTLMGPILAREGTRIQRECATRYQVFPFLTISSSTICSNLSIGCAPTSILPLMKKELRRVKCVA